MKKIIAVISALLLVLSLTHCKKTANVVQDNVIEPVAITLSVNGSSKVSVNTDPESAQFGQVTFTNGDKIYVAYAGVYVGTLTYGVVGDYFSGNVSISADPGQKLYFYFLGNKIPSESLTSSTNTLTVDISDQTGSEMPVISCGVSTSNFSTSVSSYSATLLNKCAIVKFNISRNSGANGKDVFIAGFNNKVVFDLGKTIDNNATYSQTNGGVINVGTKNGNQWLIVLPQNSDEGGTVYTSDLTFVGSRDGLPLVVANGYHYEPLINVSVNKTLPEGALRGIFSVSPSKRVFFSQGNLQYNKNTKVFSFMNKQYTKVETKNQNVGQDYADQDVISLFGWGTSGWNNGNSKYMPYNTLGGNGEYGYGYGPTDGTNYTYNLTEGYANSDWGHNPIANGGNTADVWRTLTMAEWQWLLGPDDEPIPGENCRVSSTVNGVSNARYAIAYVNSDAAKVLGMIIFPDIYTAGTPDGVVWNDNNINGYSKTPVTCTRDGWIALEEAGCVFLPAAGHRNYSNVNEYVGAQGRYWSSSSDGTPYAGYVGFGITHFYSPGSKGYRYTGRSVRLVYDVKN